MRVQTQVPETGQSIRAAAWMTVIFALFTFVVFTLSGYFRGPESLRESLVIGVPMMAVDCFIAFQLFFVLRWTSAFPPAVRWALVSVAVVVVALLQSLWDTQLRIWADTLTMDIRQQFVRSATVNMYNSGMFAALLAFQAAYAQLKRQQTLLDTARQREREAQMLALRFQLNPHFLFNTLNAISSLVVTGRVRDAEGMIDRLSSFLRGSLAADPERMVAVEDEFEMLDNYLDIESVRFGDRLLAAIDLPPGLSDAQMPPFLLQPLVDRFQARSHRRSTGRAGPWFRRPAIPSRGPAVSSLQSYANRLPGARKACDPRHSPECLSLKPGPAPRRPGFFSRPQSSGAVRPRPGGARGAWRA
jgi:hypothetical protein